jgi:hypothetical protein
MDVFLRDLNLERVSIILPYLNTTLISFSDQIRHKDDNTTMATSFKLEDIFSVKGKVWLRFRYTSTSCHRSISSHLNRVFNYNQSFLRSASLLISGMPIPVPGA